MTFIVIYTVFLSVRVALTRTTVQRVRIILPKTVLWLCLMVQISHEHVLTQYDANFLKYRPIRKNICHSFFSPKFNLF